MNKDSALLKGTSPDEQKIAMQWYRKLDDVDRANVGRVIDASHRWCTLNDLGDSVNYPIYRGQSAWDPLDEHEIKSIKNTVEKDQNYFIMYAIGSSIGNNETPAYIDLLFLSNLMVYRAFRNEGRYRYGPCMYRLESKLKEFNEVTGGPVTGSYTMQTQTDDVRAVVNQIETRHKLNLKPQNGKTIDLTIQIEIPSEKAWNKYDMQDRIVLFREGNTRGRLKKQL